MAVSERTIEPGRQADQAPVRDTRLWHSQARMSDVRHNERLIVRGEGAYVWDEDGNRLLDAPASLWYCNVGHGRAEIADAVDAQMRKLEAYHCFQQYATKPAVELAERLASMVPIADPRIFLTSGGGDGVEVAAKLARRYWHVRGRDEKKTIVARDLCYHGLHGFGTSLAGLEFNRTGQGDLLTHTARVATNDAAALERLVTERGADTIAAFFCEPIIGTGGIVHPADGYLDEVQRICKANQILLVVDEVITGFGRTGEMFASQRFGLEPDIMLLAKGITSGYLPLGAVAIAEPVWAPFWEEGSEAIFHHGITYSGHASACAAAMANIDILEREGLVKRVRSLEGSLASALKPLEAHTLVREVRTGIGLLTGIQLHDPALAEGVARRCVEAGVLMRTIAGGTLQVSPPFVIDAADVRLLADVIGRALDDLAT